MDKFVKKEVPYTTKAGVKIGLLYNKPSEYRPDEDALAFQASLLHSSHKPTLMQRINKLFWGSK
jgi:hypothetical protein